MGDYVLSCSSTADLPREYLLERGIPYICYHYIIDGKEYPDDLGETADIASFYQKIAQGAMPTTTQINITQYIEYFEPFLADGKDVLHLELSSGITSSCNSAIAAQHELAARYPERRIYIVDTLGASAGFGLLVDAAANLRDQGMPVGLLHGWIEANKLRVHHWFFTMDLTHLKRGGRVSAASAILGSMLNICPLMNVDNKGRLIPRAKMRGKKNAMSETIRRMKAFADGGADYCGKCFISHSASYEDARMLADQIEAAFPKLAEPVMISDIGTVIGAHTGPGTVATFFFGEARQD